MTQEIVIKHRIQLWDQLAAAQEQPPLQEYGVTLPDGKEIEVNNQTTPRDLAKTLGLKGVIACKQDDVVTDVWRPFEKSCKLVFLTFADPEGQHVFWHSSAHILGMAMEQKYGIDLSVGPALEEGGFYYEGRLPDGATISETELPELESLMKECVKNAHPFQRLVVKKEDSLNMFQHNPYKVKIISSKIPDDGNCTIYRCGPFIDLCRGPHLPDTGYVRAVKVQKVSSSYFLGKQENDSLQRVYGVSFPDKKLLKQHLQFLEEAEKRHHKKIGTEQELFFFSDMSPGSCFWLPHGTRIYNRLVDLMRKEYWRRGFQEIKTPAMARSELWKISGHWDKYQDDMFIFQNDGEDWSICPMNCPKHCIMFKNRNRSHKELPIRWADMSVLHRNEASGALHGLTRVRSFSQDDAHIYAQHAQIEAEVLNALNFLEHIYGIFGFEFSLELSTRPEKYLGEIEVWDQAEAQLADALNSWGKPWKISPGDGAFYGPKIDIHIRDALKRSYQCATIQLDFQLPERFDLKYVNEKGEHVRPVIVHRAIYGSYERFIGILIEHYGGKWPFWISPRQAIVVPISEHFMEYADKVRQHLHDRGYYVDLDKTDRTVKKKIREAQVAQYNYILVVGQIEHNNQSVNVRYRDNDDKKEVTLDQLFHEFTQLVNNYQ